MRVATRNCNSIRARLEYCLEWLERDGPDVVCLQETKSEDDKFPITAFQGVGYEAVYMGQKTYNGVAVLWRKGLEQARPGPDTLRALCSTGLAGPPAPPRVIRYGAAHSSPVGCSSSSRR